MSAISTYDNGEPLDGWAPVIHRESPLTLVDLLSTTVDEFEPDAWLGEN